MEYISLFNIDLFKIEGKTTWQNTLAKAMAEVVTVYPDSSPWFSSQLTRPDIRTNTEFLIENQPVGGTLKMPLSFGM